MHSLDRQRGIYLSSGYEYPGRYSRWDIASVCPPLEIVAFGRRVEFRPLNERGDDSESYPASRSCSRTRIGRICGSSEAASSAV